MQNRERGTTNARATVGPKALDGGGTAGAGRVTLPIEGGLSAPHVIASAGSCSELWTPLVALRVDISPMNCLPPTPKAVKRPCPEEVCFYSDREILDLMERTSSSFKEGPLKCFWSV